MSNRINRALESLDFMQYKDNFVENELDDELLDDCIANGSITAVLSDVISILGHRLKFVKKFSSFANEEHPNATPASQKLTEEENAQVSGAEAIEDNDDDIEDANQEFQHPEEPGPVQIMDFKRKGKMDSPAKVICYEKALASILKRTGNRRVAVLAIAGATRKGKSVFMNFVLRRLVGLQNDEIDWMGWARKAEPLTGFLWDASDERVTAGIWMWSEPFTLKSKKDGTEFDILLMDTQGVYDDQSGHREWSILMGLSLLTSSCLIFNIVHNIDEKDLLLLDEFLSFGLMALDKNVGMESESAFQKLVFLIRDWNSPSTFPYGSEGGKKLIEKKLGTKDLRETSHIAVREKLKKCFQEISCFLLPHPGPDAIEMNFNGSITFSSCAKFADQVEKSIVELLDNSELPIKNINGNPLTGQDFLALFKLYVGLFNNASMLSSEAIYKATSQGCNSAVVNKCVSFFTVELEKNRKGSSFLLDKVLEEHQQGVQEKALTLFENSRKMGTQSVINEAYNDLRERLISAFEEIKSKNLEIRAEAISRAHSDALLKYSRLMEEALATAGEFMNEDNLKGVSDAAKIRSLQLFHSLLQLTDCGDLLDEKEMLCHSIQDRMEQCQRANEERKNEAEKKLEDEVLTLVEAYVEDMDSKVHGQIISDEELQSYHAIAFKQCVDDFDEIHSTSQLYEKGRETLIIKIGTEQENLQQVMKTAYEGIKNEGELLIAEALDSYRENMMDRIGFDGELFEKSHRVVKASSMEILTKSEKIPNEKFMGKFVYELESKLHDVHVELLQILHQNKMRIEKQINKVKEDTRKNYEGAMRAFFDQREDPVLEPKLEARHNHERSLANSSLKSFYERMMGNLKNGEEQQIAGLAELAETIQNIYTKFQTVNKLRWQAFESRGYNYLAKVKEQYAKMLKNVVDNTSAREELDKENAAIIIVVETLLVEKLDPNVAKPEFVEKLLDELKDYVKVHFEESLKFFQFRLEEGLTVQAALYEAKQYYNQEMEKCFYAKDWLQTEELLLLNDNLTEAAIRKCKDDITLTENQEKQLLEAMKIVYLKYEEENSRRYPTENPSIGIDLGTTYSCVGVYINGKVKIIPNRDYDESGTTASYVAFNQDGTIDVGQAAKEQAFLNPINTIFDAKRLIGRTYSDKIVQQDIKLWPFNVVSDNDRPLIEVHGRRYRPEEISAKILAKLKQVAENYLNKTVKQAVVTVPAYFNDGQRQATRDAAAIAGLKVRILNEPTAAAIAYRLHRTDNLKRNVLIFDLGGGTFDVAVLEMKGGEIKVKATGGDTHLGGEDFDNAMVNRIIEKVKTKHGIDLARGRNSAEQYNKVKASERIRRIRDRCEAAKRNLSSTSSTVVNIDRIDENFDLNERFTRKEFEELNLAQFQKCIEIVKQTLEDAKMPKADVDDIVLVGGSTRIPKVQELLKAFFDGKKELSSSINANEAVACGAAIQAALLNGEQATSVDLDIVLSDVAPLSLGIEIVTGEMSKVIHKNSAVPCSYTEVFRTVVNNQTTVNFKVYEGEKSMASDNNCLGKFLLTGIPSAPAGKEPIDCTMRIDSEGILHVKAVSRNNGQASDIMIETYNGRMTHEEIGTARLEEHFRW